MKEYKKKYLLLFCCIFLIFSTSDSENIDLELERVDDENVNLSWNITFDDFDSILVDFNLPSDTLNRLFDLNRGKRFFIEPTSLFKIFGRHGLIAHAEGCFPNLEELLTIQQCLI